MESLKVFKIDNNKIESAPQSLGNLRNLDEIQIMRGNPLDESTLPGALIRRMKHIG
jgi:hypothetical protein